MENTEKTLGMLEIVSLRGMLESLKASEKNSVPVVKLCESYLAKLDNGMAETLICEQFVNELGNIAVTDSIKKSLNAITESIVKYSRDIRIANSIYSLNNSAYAYVAPVLEGVVAEYLSNKCKDTRDAAIEKLSIFEGAKGVKEVIEELNHDAYDESRGIALSNAPVKKAFIVNEEAKKTFSEDEIQAIVESRISEMKAAEAEAAASSVKKTTADIDTHIKLNSVIRNILKECKNEKLKIVCEQYLGALNRGQNETLLYESFISSIAPWNYLSAVDTQLSALSDRVSKYKQEIDLRKILETMKSTGSYYIVPLIEDCVADYAENKNMTNRVVLRNRLTPFEHDPFVRDIISIINDDLSLENTVYLGESVESLNNYVRTELVYSPVQYIKENECAINVKGTYYVKKGNSISKLKDTSCLSESFKTLCALINSPEVVVSSMENSIAVYDGTDAAVITEGAIRLNGTDITEGELRSLYESADMMHDEKAAFYNKVMKINEGFDQVAYIDFVKRVSAVDGSRRSVDVFKLKNKIFIDCIDENLKASTFYRDVNPIQCRSIINEHMEINVAPLFEDELPDQKALESKLSKKASEYESVIDALEEKKRALEDMKAEAADSDDIDDLIANIDAEIKDTKDSYAEYKKEADKFVKGDKDSADDSLKNEVPKDDDDDDDDKPSDDGKDPEGDELLTNETPADMEQPITSELDAEPVTDEYSDVPEFDGILDAPASSTESDSKFSVVKVSYNRNLKTGASNAQGEVIVVIPMIDANGEVHDDMKKITFMLDNDQRPIINNEYMPLDMYEEIVSAIESDPATPAAKVAAKSAPAPRAEEAPAQQTVPAIEGDVPAAVPAPAEAPAAPAEAPAPAEASDDFTDIFAGFENLDAESDDSILSASDDADESDESDAPMSYPIEIGLDVTDIKPIGKSDFEKELDGMGIEHSEAEGCESGVCFSIKNKAEAHALRSYFRDWKNFSPAEFNNFFPELKRCFDNNSSTIPMMAESFEIKGVKGISESAKPAGRGLMNIILPATKEICEMFSVDYDAKGGEIQVVTESRNESAEVYEKLYMFAKKNPSASADVMDAIEAYAPMFESEVLAKNTFKLDVPYSNILESKMAAKGFKVSSEGGRLQADILSVDFDRAKKILESFYGNAAPSSVKDFFQVAALNENVRITVRDDSTGKTVEFDLNDVQNASEGTSEGAANFSSSFDNITFDPKESLAFNDDEESAESDDSASDGSESDGSKAPEKKDGGDKNDDGEKKEKADESVEPEASSDKKPKFKFKKKAQKTDESVIRPYRNVLNEGVARATVLDYVKCSNGKKGQIIAEMANGNLILNIEGHTVECTRESVTPITPRKDNVDWPFKFDPATLKVLCEQMVECGVFMNGVQMTPSCTYVNFADYMKAKNDDEITIVLEGENTTATRKYVKIMESLDSFANLNDYVDGSVKNVSESVLVNRRDLAVARNTSNAVRCLVKKANGSWKLKDYPALSVSVKM